MAGPLALIPAAVTFAKTQAAKFLAKRAASRLGPKLIKGDKAQSLKQYGAVVNKLGKEPFKAKNVKQIKPPSNQYEGGKQLAIKPRTIGVTPVKTVRTSMWGKGPSVVDTAVGAGVGYYAGRKYKKKPKPEPKVIKT